MYRDPYYSKATPLRPKPPRRVRSVRSQIPPFLLLFCCCSQILLFWLFIVDKPQQQDILRLPPRCPNLEKRFSDIGTVLKYLLEKTKAGGPTDRQKAEKDSTDPEAAIVTVTAASAYLRTGPSLSDSPLMKVSKGTRLALEVEKNDWCQVIAPSGERAWIHSTVVSFSPIEVP